MRIVIMAWGGGTRLWPLSTETTPKQFLRLYGDQSLLQLTATRLSSLSEEPIVISTTQHYKESVRQELSEATIIAEPARKNTAGAIAYTLQSLFLSGIDPEEPILFAPADHLITPVDHLQQYIRAASSIARLGQIVTFGIVPTRPETGYGYIHVDKPITEFAGPVSTFVEKPNLETAKSYLQQGGYYRNSGMFLMSYSLARQEFEKYMPDFAPLFATQSLSELDDVFINIPEIAFDIAIMEQTKHARVVPMHIQRSDVGSRDSIYETKLTDQGENVIHGSFIVGETNSSLLRSELPQPIIVDGFDDMIVIASQDGIYITKRWRTQHIKTLLHKKTK